jgi:hypothetical protein
MDGIDWGLAPHLDEQGSELAVPYAVELIGTQLRAAGTLRVNGHQRLSDYVNLLEGFFRIEDVVLRARNGALTRVVLPELRIRLDDITIVGEPRTAGGAAPGSESGGDYVLKQRQKLVVMTAAHEIYGYAHLYELGSVTAFVDASYPRFVPMTNVRVRWLADRRLAGRFDLALLQRSHIIGVATVRAGVRSRGEGPGPAASEADRSEPPSTTETS